MAGIEVKTWKTRNLQSYHKELKRNDSVVGRMVQSIELYGFKMPLLVTSGGEVIDGHLRLKAGKRLGMREMPVVVCDGWTEEQIRGFRLMVNQSAQWAEWDKIEVGKELEELEALDFDLEWTGFDGLEIADFFDEGKAAAEKEKAGEPERCPTCKRAVRKKRAVKTKGAK